MTINNIIKRGKRNEDKYCMVITCEDNENLMFYVDNPEKGILIGIEWFSLPKELIDIIALHEGMFYQLFNNATEELISYGIVDYDLPEDLEDYDESFRGCFE